MKIGFVAHEIAVPGRHGGVGRYLRALGSELASRGHDVHAFLPGTQDTRTSEYGMTLRYAAIGERSFASAVTNQRVEEAFVRWLGEVDPDVVHFQHLFHLSQRLPELCRHAGVPYVVHVHDGALFCHDAHFFQRFEEAGGDFEPAAVLEASAASYARAYGVSDAAANLAVRAWSGRGEATLRHADRVFYVSDALRQDYERRIGWKHGNSQVLRPALDWPTGARDARPGDGVTRFGVFGLISPVKGFDRVLDAFAELDGPVELHVHGDMLTSPAEMHALQKAMRNDARIHAHGSYEPEELAPRLAAIDWVVIASRYESSSLVLDEAHACGVPVLANSVGGMPEKLADGGGLLFDARQPGALTAVMQRACESATARQARDTLSLPPDLRGQAVQVEAAYDEACASRSARGLFNGVAGEAVRDWGKTSIVILTMNELEYTRKCVESIQRHTREPYELIFVDNASSDGTLDYLHSIDGATVIANDSNMGFGGGCNQGMAVSDGEYVLLLNNDTVVTPGWLDAMLRSLDESPSRGMVGPRSNHVADIQKVADVPYDVWSLDGLDDFARRRAVQTRGLGFPIARLIGFCLLARRDVIDAIGGFDVRFGLGNFEDDDFCLRGRVAGFGTWVCDESFVHHFGSRTFIGANVDYSSSMAENWARFVQKWKVPSQLGRDGAYNPDPIISATRYDRSQQYAPLVARPYDDGAAEFERRGTALLVTADADDRDALRAAFDAALTTFGASDDITIVVRVADGDEVSLDVLGEVADAHGGELPDVVVIPASPLNDEAVVRACDVVVCHGRRASALRALAELRGAQAITIAQLDTALTAPARAA